MQKIFLNNELSMELNKLGKYITKQCYDNVFNNIGEVSFRFKEKDVKVMFCYVSVSKFKNVFTRHVCYYIDGEAVDPTIATLYGERLPEYEVSYIPIKLLSIDEYTDFLFKERRTDLKGSLIRTEIKLFEEMKENGIILIG